jgi:signal transduction histidine kinase
MATSKERGEALAQRQQPIESSGERSRFMEKAENIPIQPSRDRLLDAAAAATNILLTLDNLDEAIDIALRIIGEGSGCDRIGVLENFCVPPATIPTYHTVIYEWTRPGIVSQMSHPESGRICTTGIEPFLERYFVNGDGFGGLLAEWEEPLRSAFAAVGVESSYAVPIRVKAQWWGVLGLDYCQSPVLISPAEVAVLKTIAACIGSAIQRDRAQKGTLQAEHARSQELQLLNAELQQTLDRLEARDRLLEATAATANVLLTLDNLDEAIETALRVIGEGSGCDRINVLENVFAASETFPEHHTVIYEWKRPGIVSQMSHLESGRISTAGIETFLERYYLHGDGFRGLLAEWEEPLRSAFAAVGVVSSYSVPIRVKEQWWGVLCLDYCQSPVRVSPAEIAVLKTIATCIGSAIQRDRTQKLTLQAEHARSQELQLLNAELQQTLDRLEARERILEATATVANGLLTTENLDESISKALQLIGKNLDADRIGVIETERFDRAANLSSVGWKALYEWYSAETTSQKADAKLVTGNHEGIEEWLELLSNGQCISYVIEEMPEPFRSGQAALGVKSLHIVPIFIDDRYWGNFCMDDCREAKHRSSGELAVLKTIAACIGSAIQRDRTTKAILQAEQDRAAELKKANEVLKKSLDYLATETSLDKFLGQILGAIAEQFDSPLAEYWYHPDDTAYLGMMSWHGQTYNRSEILQQYPNHLGVDGFPVPPEMIPGEDRQPHKQYFITEDWLTDPYFKHIKWLPADNLYKQINVPLVLGSKCIGALVVRMPRGHQIATEQVELAQALAHQVTLVSQLTRLAEEAKQAAIYEERNRLAGEIHDTLAQTFTGISVQLELVKYLLQQNPTEVNSILDRIGSLVQTGLGEARRSVWSIYSANEDFADLAQKLAECVENLTAGTDLDVQIDITGTPAPLSSFVGVNLLRIGQESIVNTIKHARSSTLSIELDYSPDQISLCVKDNGRGFSPQLQTEGFGLIGISERADRVGGQLRITTQPGQGTEIFVQVPL